MATRCESSSIYRREAESLGAERILAVGASAVRDADTGEAFLALAAAELPRPDADHLPRSAFTCC